MPSRRMSRSLSAAEGCSAGTLGEDFVRDAIARCLRRDRGEVLGYGDDAVAFRLGGGALLVAHTDLLAESTDVAPGMSYTSVGRKAVTMNVSDIASKGAKPLTLLFSWGVSRGMRLSDIAAVSKGMDMAAKQYGTHVTGGDTGEAEELLLAGVALGLVEEEKLMRRSGARPGDMLSVTGLFGLTGIAYKILLERLKAPTAIRGRALKSVYEPRARLGEGLALAASGAATACMDCSDGLARSLHWLSKMSRVGFTLTKPPIDRDAEQFARIHSLDPVELALYQGGEEYELVACIDPGRWEAAKRAVESVGGFLHPIGKATRGRRIVLRRGVGEEEVEDKGWQHFLGQS